MLRAVVLKCHPVAVPFPPGVRGALAWTVVGLVADALYRQIVVPSVKTLLLRGREGSRRAAALYRAGLKPTIGSGPNGVPVPVQDPSSIGQRADKFLLPSSERSEGDRLRTRCQVGGCARSRAHCVEWASPKSLPRMLPARGACTLALLMLCMLTAAARYALAGEADMGAGVVKYRLWQALPSGLWHASGRLPTGCNLPRDAAACMSRARSCGVDLFYGAYHARWKRSMFASLQSLSGPRRGAQSVGNSECSLQSPCGGGRGLAGGIIGEFIVAPGIFGFWTIWRRNASAGTYL